MTVVWIVGGIVALFGLLALLGAFLPRAHVATSRIRLSKPPREVWDVAADYTTWPSWAPSVKAMEHLPDRDGKPAWRMVTSQGPMPWVIEVDEPPRRRVTRILDEGMPYGGSWIWEIEPDGAGSRVSITEDGFIRNLVFRTLGRFVFGYHATIDKFLAALAKRMGDEGATVERVR